MICYLFPFPYRIGFAHIGRVGSVAVTVSLSVERYLETCHPTKTFSSKHLLIILPISFAVLYNIPKFYELEPCHGMQGIPSNTTELGQANHGLKAQGNGPFDRSFNEFVRTAFGMEGSRFVADSSRYQKSILPHGNTSATRATEPIAADDCDPTGVRATELRNNRWYIIFYIVASNLILVEILPWALVIFLNLSIYNAILKFQRRRIAMLKTQNGKLNLH